MARRQHEGLRIQDRDSDMRGHQRSEGVGDRQVTNSATQSWVIALGFGLRPHLKIDKTRL